MLELQEINGKTYEVEVTENELLAREICKDYEGYSIKRMTDGYNTRFFKCFENKKLEIGRVFYNYETKKFHLFKYCDPKTHVLHNANEVGVNGNIYAKLRVGDYIHFNIGKKKYKIRVEKAAKVGNYKNFYFKGYNSELQFFIPVSALTEISKKKGCK